MSMSHILLMELGIFIFLFLSLLMFFSSLYMQTLIAGAPVSFRKLLSMRLKRLNAKLIVQSYIMAVKAGIHVTVEELESHLYANGNILRVVQALITADKVNIRLPFKQAAAIDLSGRDVLEAIQMSINPKVLETPVVKAISKDGIQLSAKAQITVRANIDRLLGGAGEETIISRVGEGIVATIGSIANHKLVLEKPDLISKRVLEKRVDFTTAFEILSLDIIEIVKSADTDVLSVPAELTDPVSAV